MKNRSVSIAPGTIATLAVAAASPPSPPEATSPLTAVDKKVFCVGSATSDKPLVAWQESSGGTYPNYYNKLKAKECVLLSCSYGQVNCQFCWEVRLDRLAYNDQPNSWYTVDTDFYDRSVECGTIDEHWTEYFSWGSSSQILPGHDELGRYGSLYKIVTKLRHRACDDPDLLVDAPDVVSEIEKELKPPAFALDEDEPFFYVWWWSDPPH